MANVNAAIVYLTQNTEVRRVYLKTSLYFLFRHFNDRFRYPVIVLHDGDYDRGAQEDILLGIRSSCRSLVSFRRIDRDDFAVPTNIDKTLLARALRARPVPWWRTERYRMMCRWWLVHMWRYVEPFDYVMRLDDDSFIEEPIRTDLFARCKRDRLVFASNLVHRDCGVCCYGMKQFFLRSFPDKRSAIERQFVERVVGRSSDEHRGLARLLSVLKPARPARASARKLWEPIIYYNNFQITKTSFWTRPEVLDAIARIDASGGIFYYRWGDAPLQTLLVHLFARPSEVAIFPFRYSKRAQRESFRDDDGRYHSQAPATYAESSSLLDQR